ncbi:ribonuclease E inhibitor RraB [Roseovarius sp. D0-M9]|uniref:ribonuclease E inhibitor RraB n=1 Tax=Roseovarius sp. D0-M9 TaxID=3127117 RepID=UPI00300FB7BB
MTHDFAAQKAETYAVWAEIAEAADLPDVADIDYAFVAEPAADWEAAEAALNEAGFETARTPDEDGTLYLAACLPDQPATAMSVWLGEEASTRLVLPHGFLPDGWGFEG